MSIRKLYLELRLGSLRWTLASTSGRRLGAYDCGRRCGNAATGPCAFTDDGSGESSRLVPSVIFSFVFNYNILAS